MTRSACQGAGRSGASGLLLLAVLLLSGCGSPAAYRGPITRFQLASTVVLESARVEYSGANKRERDAAIDRLSEQREPISLVRLNSGELRLLGSDDFEARLAALEALAKHGELLLALAGSDAPKRAAAAARAMDGALAGLSGALGRVPSGRFKGEAEGFAAIAAEAAKLALERQITRALDRAIGAAETNVQAVVEALREDLGALHERRRAQLSRERVVAVDKYNKELAEPKPSAEKLKAAAAEIKKAEDAWDKLPLRLGAGPGLDAMAAAHKKLADYARSPKTPQDLSELIEAMDAFAVRAKAIADAAKTIRDAREDEA